MKLKNILEISGKIICETGLHIGAGDMEMHIGGVDNPVIKHPHTGEPYIPGSSLKGKVRSLLEMTTGLMARTDGKPLSYRLLNEITNAEEKKLCSGVLTLFGCSGADNEESPLGPTRVSFSDCPLCSDWRKQALEQNFAFTEVKSENSINRIKGTAENPRFTERVPASTVFRFFITIKEMEDDENLLDLLFQGMRLLELDALGGSGSRGYGRVRFVFDDETMATRFKELTVFSKEG